MTKIIGLSGKKGSGKTWLAKYLKENSKEIFGTDSVVIKPLAEPLKKLCIEILGLTNEQVYGTDEQKNTVTRYYWQDMPHYFEVLTRNKSKKPKYGLMTAREVVQEVGTGIFRKMYSEVWTQACINGIKSSGADIAIVDDVRFPNEVWSLQIEKGFVFRLPRVYSSTDEHISEKALDESVFGREMFDGVIGDASDNYETTTKLLLHKLQRCGLAAPSQFETTGEI